MNPLALLKIGGLIGIIAAAFFAIQSYKHIVQKNVQLTQQVETLKAEKQSLQNVVNTQSDNETKTQTILKETHTKEIEIRNEPVTTNCVSSPAIGTAIRLLDQTDTTPTN